MPELERNNISAAAVAGGDRHSVVDNDDINGEAARRKQSSTYVSMQYYRMWIYSCNWVLGVTSAVFIVFAIFVLADFRLSLIGGIRLYHPTFLYAYLALILQCGLVQTIGYLGAQRLSHRLLSAYWALLLLLTIGDVVVGLVWVFKLDRVKLSFRQTIHHDFRHKYASDPAFTYAWNKIQVREHCCGVRSPQDFADFSTSSSSGSSAERNDELVLLPPSCCSYYLHSEPSRDAPLLPQLSPPSLVTLLPNISESVNNSSGKGAVANGTTNGSAIVDVMVPAFNRNIGHSFNNAGRRKTRHYVHHRRRVHPTPLLPYQLNETLDSLSSSGLYKINVPHFQSPPGEETTTTTTARIPLHLSNWLCPTDDPYLENNNDKSDSPIIHQLVNSTGERSNGSVAYSTEHSYPLNQRYSIHRSGCQFKLLQWLDYASGLLFIMGFCVIGFIKVCFLVILRCEIREMIAKIQNIESEQAVSPTRSTCNRDGFSCNERKESRSNYFAGITIKSPPEDGDGGNNGRDGMLGARLGRHDRSNSHSQETVNMTLFLGTSPRIPNHSDHKQGMNSRKLSWNEPCLSSFIDESRRGSRGWEQDEKFIRIPNHVKKDYGVSNALAAVPCKPKDLSLASNHNKSLEQQRNTEDNNINEILAVVEQQQQSATERNLYETGNKQQSEAGVTRDPYVMMATEKYPPNGNNNIKTSNSFTLALIGTAV